MIKRFLICILFMTIASPVFAIDYGTHGIGLRILVLNSVPTPKIQKKIKIWTKQNYINLITKTAIQYGVDPATALAFARKESSFNPFAFDNNKKGKGPDDIRQSRGLFGLTFATAKSFGAKKIADLYDPVKCTIYGVLFIKYLMDKYPVQTLKELAERYNLGEPRFNDGKTAHKYSKDWMTFFLEFKGEK